MEQVEVKHCSVVDCGTSSDQYPYLFFLKVPATLERRILWCDSMGIAVRKGRMFCCTRHFDIPEDFEGADSSEAGMRLKLKNYVLPHKAIPFLSRAKNIYLIFNEMYRSGKLEPDFKSIIPAIEHDLNVKLPLAINSDVQDRAIQFLVDEVTKYFSGEAVKSRYQLVQHLTSQRNAIFELVNEKPPSGTLLGSLHYGKIKPFLSDKAEGCLHLPVDPKQLEQLYFESDSKELSMFCRPPSTDQLADRSDNNNFYPDLFFSPGIRINFNLPFLQVLREVHANCEQFLVDSKSDVTKAEQAPNCLDPFQKFDSTSSNQLSQTLTLEYINILLNLLGTHEFMLNERQRMTLLFLLQQIKRELEEFEMNQLHTTYGYFLSPFKFFRVINEDIRPNDLDADSYLYVKEVVNPEVNFQINGAIGSDEDIAKIGEFFQPIVRYLAEGAGSVDGKQYLKFADMLKRAITYTCMDCNCSFDSALAHVMIQEHRFCGKKMWKCTNCKQGYEESGIASSGWRHDCIDSSY